MDNHSKIKRRPHDNSRISQFFNRKLVADLLPCFRELAPLCEGLEDTIMLANSDNMMGDLAFYQNVRQAAKRGVVGADTIYNDLKTRFPGRPRNEPPAPPVP